MNLPLLLAAALVAQFILLALARYGYRTGRGFDDSAAFGCLAVLLIPAIITTGGGLYLSVYGSPIDLSSRNTTGLILISLVASIAALYAMWLGFERRD